MYSLATLRTLFLALRSELCSIGTGVGGIMSWSLGLSGDHLG